MNKLTVLVIATAILLSLITATWASDRIIIRPRPDTGNRPVCCECELVCGEEGMSGEEVIIKRTCNAIIVPNDEAFGGDQQLADLCPVCQGDDCTNDFKCEIVENAWCSITGRSCVHR